MTSKELVLRAVEFRKPERIPLCLDFQQDEQNMERTKEIAKRYESDFVFANFSDPEFVPLGEGFSEWGYKMENFGETMGEVKDFPLKDWGRFDFWKSHLPDYSARRGYENARKLREQNPDKFLVGGVGMMMETILNLRGYENTMIDYFEEEEALNRLIDCLYDCGKKMVDGFAGAGMDGIMAWEDWGLQTGPMMSYGLWEEFYAERMKDFVDYIHKKGMKYFLHSCGHIAYLMDTFVEFGIDAIQMDQQRNMGFDLLEQWSGRICFMCPVDIQHSVGMTEAELGDYAREMVRRLGTPEGGFIYKSYPQPVAIRMPESQLEKEILFMKGMESQLPVKRPE
ncbi:MAG: uroporphyrinogen decarboxylase family protein [Eubacteriales bacterium]|nr:uroporphyrinogen decarboxylase family protein [Eubacteriales bacterium]